MTNTMSDASVSAANRTDLGAVTGVVAATLRIEALLVLVGAIMAYRALDGHWSLFALLFLIPDLSMLGYLINKRVGASMYNIGHSYLSPTAVAFIGWALLMPVVYSLSLIWVAHIAFDRVLGYGLKYNFAFEATHLGWRGKRAQA